MHQVFVHQNYTHTPRDFEQLIDLAVLAAGAEPVRQRSFMAVGRDPSDVLKLAVKSSAAVVCDVTHHSAEATYILGLADGLAKPSIVIASESSDFRATVGARFVHCYSPHPGSDLELFGRSVSQVLKNALDDAPSFLAELSESAKRMSVFVSYSHADATFLSRLRAHLRPIERENRIDIWSDQRLLAGDDWRANIRRAIHGCRVAVILVSADFLASEFINSDELPSLLHEARTRGATIVPVVVKPCRFARDPLLSKFQAANDPARPLSSLSVDEQEKVWDQVAQRVEGFTVD